MKRQLQEQRPQILRVKQCVYHGRRISIKLKRSLKDVGVITLRKLRKNRHLEGILKDTVAIYVKRSK